MNRRRNVWFHDWRSGRRCTRSRSGVRCRRNRSPRQRHVVVVARRIEHRHIVVSTQHSVIFFLKRSVFSLDYNEMSPGKDFIKSAQKTVANDAGWWWVASQRNGQILRATQAKFLFFFSCVLRFVSADARGVENCNLNRGGRTEEESFAPFFFGFVCLFVSLGRFIGAGF